MPAHNRATASRPRRPAVTERRAGRREQYLDAITDAIRIYGSEQTMDQLAAAAGVSKPLLYTHFGDRVGLAAALAERAAGLAPDSRPASSGPATDVVALCDRFVGFAETDPHLFRWLLRVSHDRHDVLDALLGTSAWRDLVAATGLARPDPHAVDVLTAGITGFVLAATERWSTWPGMTRDALVHYLSTFIELALHPPR